MHFLQDYQTIMGTNIEPAFHLCQLCLPMLKASGNGCILFNSSVSGGPTAMFSGSLYAMTKAALNQLTKNLACEVGAVLPQHNTAVAQQF